MALTGRDLELSKADQDRITQLTEQYSKATTQEEKDRIHDQAEAIRNQNGYQTVWNDSGYMSGQTDYKPDNTDKKITMNEKRINESTADYTPKNTQAEKQAAMNEQRINENSQYTPGVSTVNSNLDLSKPESVVLGDLSSSDVRKVQTFLKDNGYDIGAYGVDGSAGPDTRAAWSKYLDDLYAAQLQRQIESERAAMNEKRIAENSQYTPGVSTVTDYEKYSNTPAATISDNDRHHLEMNEQRLEENSQYMPGVKTETDYDWVNSPEYQELVRRLDMNEKRLEENSQYMPGVSTPTEYDLMRQEYEDLLHRIEMNEKRLEENSQYVPGVKTETDYEKQFYTDLDELRQQLEGNNSGVADELAAIRAQLNNKDTSELDALRAQIEDLNRQLSDYQNSSAADQASLEQWRQAYLNALANPVPSSSLAPSNSSSIQDVLSSYTDWQKQYRADQDKAYEQLLAQQKSTTDYNTQKNVDALKRQWEDAQKTYDQERAKADYNAKQSLDNLRLYNARIGEQGGLGNKQYSEQQANFDNQILSLDLQQAQLKTDIDRQVQDYINQGDYANAQAALELGIQKLNNITDQTNSYYNTMLSAAGTIDNYNLNQQSAALSKRSQDLNYFNNLLDKGIFDAQAAVALGIPPEEAMEYASYVNRMNSLNENLAKAQIANTYATIANKSASGNNSGSSTPDSVDVYDVMNNGGIRTENDAYRYLIQNGFTSTEAERLAADYPDWRSQQNVGVDRSEIADSIPITNKHGASWVYVDGVGRLTYQELQRKVDNGSIIETANSDGTYTYRAI